jgi:hypothetical protein
MTLFILSLGLGVVIGYIWRRNDFLVQKSNHAINLTVLSLLFLMGITLSLKTDILSTLSTLGWEALVISSGSLGGSCLAARILQHTLLKERNE